MRKRKNKDSEELILIFWRIMSLGLGLAHILQIINWYVRGIEGWYLLFILTPFIYDLYHQHWRN